MAGLAAPLSPTLWRTCRALANARRLALLRHLIRSGPECVTEVARAEGVSLSSASQCLRALNARGLLRARREGRQVRYEVGADPSLPESALLLQAIQPALTKVGSTRRVMFQLTGFTHPRRIAIVRAMAGGPLALAGIRRATGMCKQAALRHLRKLERRGLVVGDRGRYRCARPRSSLSRALLAVAANPVR